MRIALIAFLIGALVPFPVAAQTWAQKQMADTDTTVGTSVAGPNEAADEVLADGSWTIIDVINDCDVDVVLKFPDLTGDPTVFIPAGTSWTENFGSNGGYVGSSAELYYFASGSPCTTGNVHVRGVK